MAEFRLIYSPSRLTATNTCYHPAITLPTFTNTSLMDWPYGFVKSFHPMVGLELDWRNWGISFWTGATMRWPFKNSSNEQLAYPDSRRCRRGGELQTTAFLSSALGKNASQTSGEYCDNTFQYCKVRRALNSASLHRPFLASEGREICEIFWFTGRKRTPARRMPPSEHTSACTAGAWLARLYTHHANPNSGLKHIRDRFTCDTSSLVYVITCSKCNSVYVGETGQSCSSEWMAIGQTLKTRATRP